MLKILDEYLQSYTKYLSCLTSIKGRGDWNDFLGAEMREEQWGEEEGEVKGEKREPPRRLDHAIA